MLAAILTGLFILAFLGAGWFFWQMRNALLRFIQLHSLQPQTGTELTRQVDELHQTMDGVMNTLNAVGNQVYNLNMLAGNVLQEAQQQAAQQTPQILIEIRREQPGEGDPGMNAQQPQMLNPEDISPEMLERFKAFEAVYRALMAQQAFPSQQHPDLN